MYEKLIPQLARHEGLRLQAYKDTKGIWTIGIGRNIEHRGFSQGELSTLAITPTQLENLETLKISKESAYYLLNNDIQQIEKSLQKYGWFKFLSDVRKDIIINMVFNIGERAFIGFRNFILDIDNARWEEASHEMLRSKWYIDVGKRAKELSEMMRRNRYLTPVELAKIWEN